jgi:hypothetical protein
MSRLVCRRVRGARGAGEQCYERRVVLVVIVLVAEPRKVTTDPPKP